MRRSDISSTRVAGYPRGAATAMMVDDAQTLVPPVGVFYTVAQTDAAIAAAILAALPPGIIVVWKGTIATIPAGWHLCDGTNGTDDLRNSFVPCADVDTAGVPTTSVTGSATSTGGAASIDGHTGYTDAPSATQEVQSGTGTTVAGASHTHDLNISSHSTSLPPYYAKAYIQRL